MAKVLLKDLNKTYDGGVNAVKNVNLEIHDHEFVVLVGPSGCGKTTTLRMVAGLRTSPRARSASTEKWSTTSRRWTAISPWCSRTTRSIHT